jgi:hypothetical protein
MGQKGEAHGLFWEAWGGILVFKFAHLTLLNLALVCFNLIT